METMTADNDVDDDEGRLASDHNDGPMVSGFRFYVGERRYCGDMATVER